MTVQPSGAVDVPAPQPADPAPPGTDVSPPSAERPSLARGTLGRQLVLRTTLLVALVTIVLSSVTAFASYQIQLSQLDERLEATAGRALPGGGLPPDHGDVFAFQSIQVVAQRTGSGEWVIFAGQSLLPEGITAAGELQLVSLADTRSPATVSIDGVGSYRVMVRTDAAGTKTIVGLPMSMVWNQMATLIPWAAVLTLGSILVAFFAARGVVVRSLRPLNRLAATATAVSNLDLDRGEVSVPRVAAADARPVSEVGRVGLAFNHMLDNVEGALAARHESETKLRQFVADASHELRNPLASIRGYSELTRRGRSSLPDDTAHALSRIESESDRMSTLVEDLLLLARLDSGPNLALAPTDLTDIVVNAVSDAQVAGPGHEWSLSLPEEPVRALADAHRIHQVIVNLLANARTHTPPGTEVETSLSQEDEWAIVRVHDNGPGIPPEILPRVFERFTRADASRYRQVGEKSTGLGLAIVDAVVTAHGGIASVRSQPGDTTFTVRLPLAH